MTQEDKNSLTKDLLRAIIEYDTYPDTLTSLMKFRKQDICHLYENIDCRINRNVVANLSVMLSSLRSDLDEIEGLVDTL